MSLYETHETEAKCKTNIQCLCPSITNILWSDSNITMPMMALNSNVKLDVYKAKCYIHQSNSFFFRSSDDKSVNVQRYMYIKVFYCLFFLQYLFCFNMHYFWAWKCGNSSWMTARFDKIFNNANFPDKGLKQNTILFVQVWILFEHVGLECGWLVCKLYSLFIVC